MATVSYLIGLAVCLLGDPNHVGFAELASFILIMSLVGHRRVRLAFWASGGSLFLLLLSPPRHVNVETLLNSFLGWLICIGLAWLLGLGLRAVRSAGQRALEETLRAQRQEIANELHDNVTHDLALIIMHAEQAILSRGSDPTGTMTFLAATARRCDENTRHLMKILSGSEIAETSSVIPLMEVLKHAEGRLRSRGFSTAVMTDGDPAKLPRSVEASLARITREATNNMIRHGDPQAPASIILDVDEHSVELAFINRKAAVTSPGSGIGTRAMRERVEALGGEFTAALREDQWATRLVVPF